MHIILMAVLTVLIAGTHGISAADQPRLVLALKPDKNPEAMSVERADLGRVLSQTLGRQVEVIIPISAAIISTGFANGTIDASHLSATDFAKDAMSGDGPARIARAVQVGGLTTYSSVWVTLSDKPYTSVRDLASRPVAFASRTSTSGCIVPLYHLQQLSLIAPGGGPADFFGAGNVFYGTGYVSAVDRVLDGSAEAAAVSDYVLSGTKYLKPEQQARLRVLATQGPVPTHVLAVRRNLARPDADALVSAIANIEPGLRDRVFGGPLIQVDEQAHLAPIRAALQAVQSMKL